MFDQMNVSTTTGGLSTVRQQDEALRNSASVKNSALANIPVALSLEKENASPYMD